MFKRENNPILWIVVLPVTRMTHYMDELFVEKL